MRRILVSLFALLLVSCPVLVLAQEAVAPVVATADEGDVEQIVEDVTLLVDLFKDGQWSLAIGLLLTLLVMVFRKFIVKYIPSKYLPWVAVALGVLGSVGVGLSAGVIWWKAILQGFIAGATASGLWELLFKHLKKKATEEPVAPPVIPAT
jgi:uncharacterized integral membrane protein